MASSQHDLKQGLSWLRKIMGGGQARRGCVQGWKDAVGDEWLRACSIITGESLARHEVRTVFRRREAEGILRSGQAATLYSELNADIVAGDITIQRETTVVKWEFDAVLKKCFSQTAPTFIRTDDALHLAAAKVKSRRSIT